MLLFWRRIRRLQSPKRSQNSATAVVTATDFARWRLQVISRAFEASARHSMAAGMYESFIPRVSAGCSQSTTRTVGCANKPVRPSDSLDGPRALSFIVWIITTPINPLIATLKPYSNGSSYSNTVLVHWPLIGGLSHLVQLQPAQALLAVPNVTAHISTTSVPTSYYSMWHDSCLWSLNG